MEMPTMAEQSIDLSELLHLMERLRDPVDGCPWDREQNFASIAPHTLEECFELIDAIEQDDLSQVEEELGDVLFQVVFYAQLGRELGRFDLQRVADRLVEKLLRRHPHVFPDGSLSSRATEKTDVAAIKATWERIKSEERRGKAQTSLLADIPRSLPALSRAQKVQKRVSQVGFDWPDRAGVYDKLSEELTELAEAVDRGVQNDIAAELGDLLFTVVNLGRHLKVDCEAALRGATGRFEKRVQHMESAADHQGRSLVDETPEQLDERWNHAKRETS